MKLLIAATLLALLVGSLRAYAGDECNIQRIAKLIVAHEGGTLDFVDQDCTQSSLVAPHARNLEITELDGRITLVFRYDAPPKLGSPEHFAIARMAALATGRAYDNAEWLVRQCLIETTAHWGKDDDFGLNIPPTDGKRLDRQSFSCGPEKFAEKDRLKVRFSAAFEWPDPHR